MEEYTWQTIILIPKGNNESRGIGTIEVIWKTVTGILNRCLTVLIQFHNTLRVLLAGGGNRTASLKSKLLQQLVAMR